MRHAPLSLAQHFEAPEGFCGHFGWLCGYSAEASFLNDAVERFSHLQVNQRANVGRTLLALMLDPRAQQITPVDAPGCVHLLWAKGALPFNLMHAKVAVLYYRSANDQAWCLRLLVSTGNWTRQTLEQSLDLVWRLDLHSKELATPGIATAQIRTDIYSAWDLLSWLQRHYDCTALEANRETAMAVTQMRELLRKHIKPVSSALTARFFDNRKASLLSQLAEKVVHVSGKVSARNYLAMGSGFYESSLAGEAASVPVQIIEHLRGKRGGPRLLKNDSATDLYVNEASCQGIALAAELLADAQIEVRPAAIAPYFPKAPAPQPTLHAKFIFSADETRHGKEIKNPWIYLGSGNLTRQGFAQKMGRSAGNLEAGVVFAPPRLNWCPKEDGVDPASIGYYLPIHWDSTCNPQALQQGSDLDVGNEVFRAAPVAYLQWRPVQDSEAGWLNEATASPHDYEVLDRSGLPCRHLVGEGFAWTGQRPRQVVVSWCEQGGAHRATVPVLDEYGRLASTELQALSLEDAWMQLDQFPQPPAEDELPNAFDRNETSRPQNGTARTQATPPSSYPIRQMMALIEGIATKQTAIEPQDWSLWCARLEQSLIQAADCQWLQQFLALELNPIHALRHPAFRPVFAENKDKPAGQQYETALNRIEAQWRLLTLHPLGPSA